MAGNTARKGASAARSATGAMAEGKPHKVVTGAIKNKAKGAAKRVAGAVRGNRGASEKAPKSNAAVDRVSRGLANRGKRAGKAVGRKAKQAAVKGAKKAGKAAWKGIKKGGQKLAEAAAANPVVWIVVGVVLLLGAVYFVIVWISLAHELRQDDHSADVLVDDALLFAQVSASQSTGPKLTSEAIAEGLNVVRGLPTVPEQLLWYLDPYPLLVEGVSDSCHCVNAQCVFSEHLTLSTGDRHIATESHEVKHPLVRPCHLLAAGLLLEQPLKGFHEDYDSGSFRTVLPPTERHNLNWPGYDWMVLTAALSDPTTFRSVPWCPGVTEDGEPAADIGDLSTSNEVLSTFDPAAPRVLLPTICSSAELMQQHVEASGLWDIAADGGWCADRAAEIAAAEHAYVEVLLPAQVREVQARWNLISKEREYEQAKDALQAHRDKHPVGTGQEDGTPDGSVDDEHPNTNEGGSETSADQSHEADQLLADALQSAENAMNIAADLYQIAVLALRHAEHFDQQARESLGVWWPMWDQCDTQEEAAETFGALAAKQDAVSRTPLSLLIHLTLHADDLPPDNPKTYSGPNGVKRDHIVPLLRAATIAGWLFPDGWPFDPAAQPNFEHQDEWRSCDWDTWSQGEWGDRCSFIDLDHLPPEWLLTDQHLRCPTEGQVDEWAIYGEGDVDRSAVHALPTINPGVAPCLVAPVETLLAAAATVGLRSPHPLGGGGHRTFEEQAEWCIGWPDHPEERCQNDPPRAWPGRSRHQYGLAVDFYWNAPPVEELEGWYDTLPAPGERVQHPLRRPQEEVTVEGLCEHRTPEGPPGVHDAAAMWQATCHRVLARFAPVIGLLPFEVEPWHWSTDGH